MKREYYYTHIHFFDNLVCIYYIVSDKPINYFGKRITETPKIPIYYRITNEIPTVPIFNFGKRNKNIP